MLSLSTSIHLLLKGRITGMSGIFNGLITLDKSSRNWKFSCFFGMASTSGYLYYKLRDNKYGKDQVQFFDEPCKMVSNLSYLGFAVAGLFVGFGTKLANGCTSGHVIIKII